PHTAATHIYTLSLHDALPISLSQIGVAIGPLLAGAGVVGIAVGFGAQRLIQDVITGMLVLFENAIQIGDWITVAGLSGTVERLRSEEHTSELQSRFDLVCRLL